MKNKLNKITKSFAASAMAGLVLLSGTFAWNAFDQIALNEIKGQPKGVGARLHDDFDGSNKDVYIENYGGEGSDLVFARIRLDEYMEIGEGAGTGTTGLVVLRGDKEKVVGNSPVANDATTWDTYLYGSTADGSEQIRKYRDLVFGGDTIYMPTFNKHIYNLDADINGTMQGPDKNATTDNDAYDDYKTYSDGEELTGDAKYATEDQDEENQRPDDYIEVSETHTAKPTLTSTVLSIDDWKANGSKPGAYWIYDTNGWAYWAQPIAPQTATGLLLTEVIEVETPTAEWYYAVNVVAQMATAGDWGSEENDDGFYEGGMSEDIKDLFDKIAGLIEGVDIELSITSGKVDLQVGESVSLLANVTVPADYSTETGYTWSITERSKSSGLSQAEIDDTFQDGTFTPVASMVGNTYVLTATADLNLNAKDSVIVNVYDVNDTTNVYISLSAAGDATEVEAGDTLQFTAATHGLVDRSVTWSVTGGTGTTAIDETGLLTVDEDQADASTLTVKAEANANRAVFKELPISVIVPEPSLGTITPGSDTTVTIDGVEWYVLETATDSQGNKMAKIFAAQNVLGTTTKQFDASTNVWENSEMRNTTLIKWINESSLKDILVYDHPDRGNSDYSPELKAGSGLEDAVFLLSKAEYDKVNDDGSPYLTDTMKKTTITWWLRTPGSITGRVLNVSSTGTLGSGGNYTTATNGVRPVLWVYI